MFGVADEVKVGVKSQIVIPARIRADLRIVPGDILIMTADRNGRVSMVKKPRDWAKAALGCCKGVWGDNASEYMRKERDESWT
jgi:AbrB family looped-hinge helix DNA binding protein